MTGNKEFPTPDYNVELGNVERLIEKCKKTLVLAKAEGIPYFSKVLERELDAILDNLIIVDHYHAASRCLRAALELTAKNIYLVKYGHAQFMAMSFSDKYYVPYLSSRKNSPLRRLVRDETMPEYLFLEFRENYRKLSKYVHYRTTYDLYHTLRKHFPRDGDFAKVMKMSGDKTKEAFIVKATLMKFELLPALNVLLELLKIATRI